MLYMNTVYDWPFDATHGLGAQNVDVLDIHGNPHMEQCDPGIYPSFFLDHGRPAGQQAFLNIFRKHILNSSGCDDSSPPHNFSSMHTHASKESACTPKANA